MRARALPRAARDIRVRERLTAARSGSFASSLFFRPRDDRSGALHKIAFKRGVFPRGSFAPSDRFGGAEALQARDDPVARRLLDQLGKGVFAAVKAKYARTITYYVVGPPSVAAKGDENGGNFSEKGDAFEDADDETERVLEEYAFTIRYGDETSPAGAASAGPAGDVFENVSVRATTKTSRLDAFVSGGRERRSASSSLDDEEKIKDAGDQMLRQLEALIEHLDPVPVGSRIGIRLTYVDATPPEYEPPFFESVEPSDNAKQKGGLVPRGERRECGSVETRFHALSLRWTGLAGADRDAEDPADEEADLDFSAKRKASALFPFPFESQPEPEPEPVVECRDYHYLSQSEPQLDSEELEGRKNAAAPARSPPRIGWADGFAGGPADGRGTGPGPGPGQGPGPAFSLTGSLPLSRAPSSPFTPVGGGSRGAGRRAGDSAASFSFGGGGSVGGSQASLGANASLGFGGFGGFGGGGFGSPIRRGSAVATGGATGKRAGAFPTPPSTPWRKRLRSADAVAI